VERVGISIVQEHRRMVGPGLPGGLTEDRREQPADALAARQRRDRFAQRRIDAGQLHRARLRRLLAFGEHRALRRGPLGGERLALDRAPERRGDDLHQPDLGLVPRALRVAVVEAEEPPHLPADQHREHDLRARPRRLLLGPARVGQVARVDLDETLRMQPVHHVRVMIQLQAREGRVVALARHARRRPLVVEDRPPELRGGVRRLEAHQERPVGAEHPTDPCEHRRHGVSDGGGGE
jgi:hypothetical protein